jgi:5'-nucleotidase/UDP-sugar diphosphatase
MEIKDVCRRRGGSLCSLVLLLFFLLLPPAAAGKELSILHINDLHGWLLPHPYGGEGVQEGGAARLAALVRRETTARTLFLAAGDLMQGTNISNYFRGRPVIEALNDMGLDASAVGNHDFDYGLAVLEERAAEASFPFLAANVEGEDAAFLKPFTLVDRGGLRIALFGLTTERTPLETHPKNVRGLAFPSALEAARRLVPELERRADLVICLSHLGLEEDRRLAAEVEGIDIIIGGHSHTKMTGPLRVGSTVIVQAYERGAFLGRLDVTVEEGRVTAADGRLLPVDGTAGEDREVAALVEGYRVEAGRGMDLVLGRAAVPFDGDRSRLRSRETNLGDLVADVIREAAGAQIAILNGGAVRAGIPEGPVTLAHLYNVLPFDNHVLSFLLTGHEVREALETGLSRLAESGGGFPQVSGMSFAFDPGAPAGERLREVKVGAEALAGDRVYTVATNDFIAAGGDGYALFEGRDPVFIDSSRYLRELLADYWKERGEISMGVEGRIRRTR